MTKKLNYLVLTDAAIHRCKRSVPRGYLVCGKDVRGNGVTCGLQTIIKTLEHIVVVSNNTNTPCSCENTAVAGPKGSIRPRAAHCRKRHFGHHITKIHEAVHIVCQRFWKLTFKCREIFI